MRIVFDLDGTLADLTHRLPLIQQNPRNWRTFFAAVGADSPIPQMIAVYRALQPLHSVEIWSGRSNECCVETFHWLSKHGITGYTELRMRHQGDHRPDAVVKEEWLLGIERSQWPELVFDDRNQVVAMWRRHGIRCCQVAKGDF